MSQDTKKPFERCPVCDFFRVSGEEKFKPFVVDIETRMKMHIVEVYCPDCKSYLQQEVTKDKNRPEHEDEVRHD